MGEERCNGRQVISRDSCMRRVGNNIIQIYCGKPPLCLVREGVMTFTVGRIESFSFLVF